jgi:hypothetical protein
VRHLKSLVSPSSPIAQRRRSVPVDGVSLTQPDRPPARQSGSPCRRGAQSYGTSPPSETPRDLADFQSRHDDAPRFAGKGQGNCTWSMPDGTIRRSFSRTAAGKLAGGGGRADPTPRRGEAVTPRSKSRPPPAPLVFSRYGCRSRASNRAFFALVFEVALGVTALFRYA